MCEYLEILVSVKADGDKKWIGLYFSNPECHETYIRWVWYYLGVEFGGEPPFHIVPFTYGKVVKRYKYCNNAKRQAKLLAAYVKKRIKAKKNLAV